MNKGKGSVELKYMGSKARISKYIVPIMQEYIFNNNITEYYEPFCGGCNVIDKIKCDNRFASDKNKYLIALLGNVHREFPTEIPKEEYSQVRDYYNKVIGEYEDWYVGLVGFLASFNGRFFDGGYAKTGIEKTKKGDRVRDYYNESKNNLLSQDLSGIVFSCKDYDLLNVSNSVIYCDPPYQNTKTYDSAKGFDYDKFWETIREWSKNNMVFVSEENAPEDFVCIWEQEVSRSIKAKAKSKATEKLFVHSSIKDNL